MNIAAFILSLVTGFLSLAQGGLGMVCGGSLGRMGRGLGMSDAYRMEALGGAGFLVLIAAIAGMVGGSMALARKRPAKVILGVCAVLCLMAALASDFKDAFVWAAFHAVSAILAHLDVKKLEEAGDAQSSASFVQTPYQPSVNVQPPAVAQAALHDGTFSKTVRVPQTPEPAAPAPKKTYEPVLGVETEALITRANLFLEDGNFDEADRYFEQALNQAPTNADAYLGKLLALRKLHNAGELAGGKAPFEDDALFQKALRFAGEEMKAQLCYIQAVAARGRAKSSSDFQSVAALFDGLGDYKDSKALASEAREKQKQKEGEESQAREAELERRYIQAVEARGRANSSEGFLRVAALFEELGDYKDSKALANEACEKQKQKEIEKTAVRNAKLEKKYQEALALKKKASSAEELRALEFRFDELKGYKDSETLAREAKTLAKKAQDAEEEAAAEEEADAKRRKWCMFFILLISLAALIFSYLQEGCH